MPLWDTRRVENKLRQILGLQNRPDGWMSPGFRSNPGPDGSGYFTLEKVSPEQEAADYQQLEKEGWRGELANTLARSPYIIKRVAQSARWGVQSPLQKRLALKQIGQSRWLSFESPYVLEEG